MNSSGYLKNKFFCKRVWSIIFFNVLTQPTGWPCLKLNNLAQQSKRRIGVAPRQHSGRTLNSQSDDLGFEYGKEKISKKF